MRKWLKIKAARPPLTEKIPVGLLAEIRAENDRLGWCTTSIPKYFKQPTVHLLPRRQGRPLGADWWEPFIPLHGGQVKTKEYNDSTLIALAKEHV